MSSAMVLSDGRLLLIIMRSIPRLTVIKHWRFILVLKIGQSEHFIYRILCYDWLISGVSAKVL
jgi:hypothetical protein